MAAPRTVKLTGTLRDIAAIRAKPTVLLGAVSEYLIRKNAEPSDRRQDIVHPSEMCAADWCPRQTYYRIRDVRAGRPHIPERFSAGTLAIFAEGHSIHRKWQERLTDMGLLWGKWKCLHCGHVTKAVQARPGECAGCGNETPMEYAEVPMDAEDDYMIVGHADGYVPEHRCLIEIKSVGIGTLRMDVPELLREHTVTVDGRKIHDVDQIWRNLDEPLAPHVRQANIYLHIAQAQGLDVDRMLFLYESKSNQQVREFTIKPDRQVVEPLLESAREIRHAIEFGAPPPAQALTQDSAKCKKCPYLTECWASDAATDPAPAPGRLAGQHDQRSPDRPAEPRPETSRPPGRRDAEGPGRHHRTVRRRAHEALPPDGGVVPVRE